jgi:signal transduction histidine kinase
VQSGYIAIETHNERPGIIRLFTCAEAPDPQPTRHSAQRLRYIARFNDREAAFMHTHEILKRRLIDLEAHLYRVPLEYAIGAAESLVLKHRRIYIDPELSDENRQAIDSFTARLRIQRQAWSVFFQTLGYIGVGILLLNLFVLSFR